MQECRLYFGNFILFVEGYNFTIVEGDGCSWFCIMDALFKKRYINAAYWRKLLDKNLGVLGYCL